MAESPNETPIVREPTVLTFYTGSVLKMDGGTMVPASGTQAAAIADVPTAGSATAADNATAINAMLVVFRDIELIAT